MPYHHHNLIFGIKSGGSVQVALQLAEEQTYEGHISPTMEEETDDFMPLGASERRIKLPSRFDEVTQKSR